MIEIYFVVYGGIYVDLFFGGYFICLNNNQRTNFIKISN